MRAKTVIFAILFVLGFILSTLGLISFPVFHNINYIWPAAVIEAVGAILFGWTGILAGTLFPIFSNIVTDSTYVSVYVFALPAFIQSLLPYVLFNKIRPDLKIKGLADHVIFVCCAGIIPQISGGILAASILLLIGKITTLMEFYRFVALWFIDSVPWIVVFGIPLMKIFVPILREYGYLYGYSDRLTCQNRRGYHSSHVHEELV